MICDCWCAETSLESKTEKQSDMTENLFCSLNLSLRIQSTIIFEKRPIFSDSWLIMDTDSCHRIVNFFILKCSLYKLSLDIGLSWYQMCSYCHQHSEVLFTSYVKCADKLLYTFASIWHRWKYTKDFPHTLFVMKNWGNTKIIPHPLWKGGKGEFRGINI